MIRLYVYEAFTLVFSSCIIGMCVGIIVGFTMGTYFIITNSSVVVSVF